jgi:nucleoside-diphosphate-sugar epimerase
VEDCAEGLILAAERYDGEEPVNLGVGREISIADLVAKIIEVTGFKGEVLWDDNQPDGQRRRCLDTQRARDRFGFEARTDFDTGLRKTVAWYREHAETIARAKVC